MGGMIGFLRGVWSFNLNQTLVNDFLDSRVEVVSKPVLQDRRY